MKLIKAIEKAGKERKRIKADKETVKQSDLNLQEQTGLDCTLPIYSKSRLIKYDAKTASDNKCVCMFSNADAINYYKILRARIQKHARANDWKTIMITSVSPGEGKTLTSINLALTMAKELNQTVLLIDNDLKHQKIYQYMGIDSDTGLINYFEKDTPLSDLIIWPGIDKLTLISGGKNITESAELLGSPKMKRLVAEMKDRYADRYIIFDMPPVIGCADVISFTPMVDCILMVIEAGKTSVQEIKKAVELIPEEKFLGFVLNRQTSITKQDGYYYA